MNNGTTTEQAPVQAGNLVGKYIRFQFNHLFQTVKCNLKIISVEEGIVRARIPSKIMAMPFPPYGKGKNIVRIELAKAINAISV